MQNKHWILGTTILLVVLLYLWQQKSAQPINQQVNTVTFQSKDQIQQAETQIAQKAETNTTEASTAVAETTRPKEKSDDQERTYMQVYYDLQLAAACDSFYRNNHEAKGNFDYVTKLHQAHHYKTMSDENAPEIQVSALEKRVQRCLDLKTDTFDRAKIFEAFPDYQFAYPVTVELRKELQQTIPKTPEEIHLAQTIQTSKSWRNLNNALYAVLRGDYNHDQSQRAQFQQQITALQEQISFLYQTNSENSEAIEALNNEVTQLQKQADERLPVDEAKLNEILASFFPVNEQMHHSLATSHPESFRYLMTTLHMKGHYNLVIGKGLRYTKLLDKLPENISWPQSPNQQILNQSGHKDSELFDLLIQPAATLYLCYLGTDCGADSEWVMNYCINWDNNYYNSYVDACGKSLIDFYAEDFLTANQWSDVNALFEIMVEMYAH